MNITIILLIIITYILWKIYSQHEAERMEVCNARMDEKSEQERKEKYKNYPHLIDNIPDTWLDLFGVHYAKGKLPYLKAAWLIMFGEEKEMNNIETEIAWEDIWGLSEELFEQLEKYHEGSKTEHEIAIVTYWQIVAEKVGLILKTDKEAKKEIFQKPPFTDIETIISWFPKKKNHSKKEFSFQDKKTGEFPKKSEGSEYTKKELEKQGI